MVLNPAESHSHLLQEFNLEACGIFASLSPKSGYLCDRQNGLAFKIHLDFGCDRDASLGFESKILLD